MAKLKYKFVITIAATMSIFLALAISQFAAPVAQAIDLSHRVKGTMANFNPCQCPASNFVMNRAGNKTSQWSGARWC